ncbi:MAG: transcriptional regulator, partial [Campylobacterales bacterium]|nr:transcriptional regulator [Campylobacterales bacterium]
MRILTIGFSEEFVKLLEVELGKYFICIVDSAKDLYDATNFTDFRHYELIIIVDENQRYSLEKYSNEVKKKKRETKIIVVTDTPKNQIAFFNLGVDDVIVNHIE